MKSQHNTGTHPFLWQANIRPILILFYGKPASDRYSSILHRYVYIYTFLWQASIYIYIHIYVHICTSQKECLCIFRGGRGWWMNFFMFFFLFFASFVVCFFFPFGGNLMLFRVCFWRICVNVLRFWMVQLKCRMSPVSPLFGVFFWQICVDTGFLATVYWHQDETALVNSFSEDF